MAPALKQSVSWWRRAGGPHHGWHVQGRRDAQGVGARTRPPAQLGEVTAGLGFVKGTGIDRAKEGSRQGTKSKGRSSCEVWAVSDGRSLEPKWGTQSSE